MTRRDSRTLSKIALAGALWLGAVDGLAGQAAGGGHGVVTVAGQWQITLQNDAQSFDWNVTFEQDGQTLSGFAEMQGRVFPLEGWVDGHKIMFNVTVDEPDHDAPLMFTGEIDGRSASGVMDPTDGAYPEALMDWFGEKKDG